MKIHQQLLAGYLIASAVFCFDPSRIAHASDNMNGGGVGGGAPTPTQGPAHSSMEVLIELTADDVAALLDLGESMEFGRGGALLETREGVLTFDTGTAEVSLHTEHHVSPLYEASAWVAGENSHILLSPIEANGPALHFVYATPEGYAEPLSATAAVVIVLGVSGAVVVAGALILAFNPGLFGNWF